MEHNEKLRIVSQFLYENNYMGTLASLLSESKTNFHESLIIKTGELDLILDFYAFDKNKSKIQMSLSDLFPNGNAIQHTLPSRIAWRIDELTSGHNVIVARLQPEDCTLIVASSDKLIHKLNIKKELDLLLSQPSDSISTDEPTPIMLPIPTTYEIHKGAVLNIDFHPCISNLMLTSSMDRQVCLVDISLEPDDPNLVRQRFQDHTKYVVHVKWSPTGKFFASGGYDSIINVYFSPALEKSSDYCYTKVYSETMCGAIEGLCYMHAEDTMAVCCRDDFLIHLYKAQSDDQKITKLREININANGDDFISFNGMSLSFSSDDSYLLMANDKNTLLMYSASNGEYIVAFYGAANDGFSHPIQAWHPSLSFVFCTSEDKSVCIWETRSQKLINNLKGHNGRIRDLQLCEYNGKLLMLTGAFDSTVCLWL